MEITSTSCLEQTNYGYMVNRFHIVTQRDLSGCTKSFASLAPDSNSFRIMFHAGLSSCVVFRIDSIQSWWFEEFVRIDSNSLIIPRYEEKKM